MRYYYKVRLYENPPPYLKAMEQQGASIVLFYYGIGFVLS